MLIEKVKDLFKPLEFMDKEEKINLINEIRELLHGYSPFSNEPVDFVRWVKCDEVFANDYNPNSVAPPEMELLRHSINHDGYTQPVVTWKNEKEIEVVDGFHRTRVCKELEDVNKRVYGYLPVVNIQSSNSEKKDRIAATIRHNRARGKHNVESMTDIVVELKKRNWSNNRISKELGMDADEILRLCQVSGLQEMFSDGEFSKSWDIELMSEEEIDFILDEENIEKDKEPKADRILHTYDKWECHKAGFYSTKPPGDMTNEECENIYVELLTDIPLFENTLNKVISEWVNSCEHYLSNDTMNRIAWLGQASLCYRYGIPSRFRAGFSMLAKNQQYEANLTALKYLNIWLEKNGFEKETEENTIKNKPKADIY